MTDAACLTRESTHAEQLSVMTSRTFTSSFLALFRVTRELNVNALDSSLLA